MDSLLIGLREAGQAFVGLLSMPYYYIAVLLVWWHAGRGVALQRKLFHVRLRGSVPLTLARAGAGLATGAALSAVSLAAGSALSPETLLCVWIAMLALALFKLRYICLAYAAGVLGILQAALSWTVAGDGATGVLGEAVRVLGAIDVPALLFLAGLLHIAEGLLVRIQGAKSAIPLFLEGKRGKPIGSYVLSGVWPVPLLWMVPAAGTDGFALPWSPLFGDASAWSFLAFPVLIGFSDRTETHWPEQKAKSAGNSLMLYGALIALLAAGAVFWAPLILAASIAAFVLHEGLVWFSRAREQGRNPLFVQDGRGVRILAVLPGTPAAEMGLVAGEMIRKVNGMRTRNKEELHAALERQSAFSKLEVENREGEIKFLQRARYAGEHYQLGLVLAPDEAVDMVAAPSFYSFWQLIRDAGARRRKGAAFAMAESAAGVGEQAAAEDGGGEQTAAEGGTGEANIVDAASASTTANSAVPSVGDPAAVPQGEPGLPPRRLRGSR